MRRFEQLRRNLPNQPQKRMAFDWVDAFAFPDVFVQMPVVDVVAGGIPLIDAPQ
jgi:hypothetical protein